MIGVRAVIHPDLRGRAEGGDYNIKFSVVIQIADSGAAMTAGRLGGKSGFLGERRPVGSCEVAEHVVGLVDHFAPSHVWRLHVPAADKNIFPAVVVEIGDVRAVASHGTAEQGHAALGGDIRKSGLAVISIDGKSFIVQSDEGDIGQAIVVQIAKIGAHAGYYVSLFGQSDAGVKRDFFKQPVAFVVEQKIEDLVVGDKYVRQAVSVVVSYAHSHALARVRTNSRLRRNILECSVAIVQKQLVGQRLVHFRMTILRPTFGFAVRFFVHIPCHIVHDEKVQQPIIINVHPGAADRPQRPVLLVGLGQARFSGYVGERSIAVVVIEGVAMNSGNKNVVKAVVVVIADGHADVISGARESGLFGHIGKRTVAVVSK